MTDNWFTEINEYTSISDNTKERFKKTVLLRSQAWDIQRQNESRQGINTRPQVPQRLLLTGNRTDYGKSRQKAIRQQRKARDYGFASCADLFNGVIDDKYDGKFEMADRLMKSQQWRQSMLHEGWTARTIGQIDDLANTPARDGRLSVKERLYRGYTRFSSRLQPGKQPEHSHAPRIAAYPTAQEEGETEYTRWQSSSWSSSSWYDNSWNSWNSWKKKK